MENIEVVDSDDSLTTLFPLSKEGGSFLKAIDLVVAHDGFHYVMEIVRIFIVATLITGVLLKQFLIRIAG